MKRTLIASQDAFNLWMENDGSTIGDFMKEKERVIQIMAQGITTFALTNKGRIFAFVHEDIGWVLSPAIDFDKFPIITKEAH